MRGHASTRSPTSCSTRSASPTSLKTIVPDRPGHDRRYLLDSTQAPARARVGAARSTSTPASATRSSGTPRTARGGSRCATVRPWWRRAWSAGPRARRGSAVRVLVTGAGGQVGARSWRRARRAAHDVLGARHDASRPRRSRAGRAGRRDVRSRRGRERGRDDQRRRVRARSRARVRGRTRSGCAISRSPRIVSARTSCTSRPTTSSTARRTVRTTSGTTVSAASREYGRSKLGGERRARASLRVVGDRRARRGCSASVVATSCQLGVRRVRARRARRRRSTTQTEHPHVRARSRRAARAVRGRAPRGLFHVTSGSDACTRHELRSSRRCELRVSTPSAIAPITAIPDRPARAARVLSVLDDLASAPGGHAEPLRPWPRRARRVREGSSR